MNTKSEYVKGLCSIVCLGYKHAAFVKSCIEALWKQSYRHIEIIAVDDGSGDGTVDILKGLKQQSPCPFIILDQENTGNVGMNFNRGVAEASGEFISVMSMDDMLYPQALAEKVEIFEKDSSCAFVANSKITAVDDNGETVDGVPPLDLDTVENPTVDDLIWAERDRLGAFYIQGTLFKREIVDAVGGFDEDMTGDDIILRTKVFLYLKKHPELSFRILHTPSCFYRKHGDNISSNEIRQLKIVSEYYDRYWPDTPYPDVFMRWIGLTISNNNVFKVLSVFSFSKRMADLLKDEKIRNILIEKACNENRSWGWYVFRIQRKEKKRKVVIFNFIKFSL